MSIFAEFARPFPDKYVSKNPSGYGSYVPHHIVNQRLIAVLGEPPDFELVRVIRGFVPERPATKDRPSLPAIQDAVVGVVARMTIREQVPNGYPKIAVAEEAGDCEDPHNWPHDGARLKDAMSDAYKRCAMRLGCGLHLWSGSDYFLYDQLKDSGGGPSEPRGGDQAPGLAVTSPAPPETSEQSAFGEGVDGSESAGEGDGSGPPSPATPQDKMIAAFGGRVAATKRAQTDLGKMLKDVTDEEAERLIKASRGGK